MVSVVADKFAHEPGEEIVFSIAALDDAKTPVPCEVAWTLDADDGRAAETGSGRAVPDAPVVVRTKMEKPVFLRLAAKFGPDGTKTFIAGAAGIRKGAAPRYGTAPFLSQRDVALFPVRNPAAYFAISTDPARGIVNVTAPDSAS